MAYPHRQQGKAWQEVLNRFEAVSPLHWSQKEPRYITDKISDLISKYESRKISIKENITISLIAKLASKVERCAHLKATSKQQKTAEKTAKDDADAVGVFSIRKFSTQNHNAIRNRTAVRNMILESGPDAALSAGLSALQISGPSPQGSATSGLAPPAPSTTPPPNVLLNSQNLQNLEQRGRSAAPSVSAPASCPASVLSSTS